MDEPDPGLERAVRLLRLLRRLPDEYHVAGVDDGRAHSPESHQPQAGGEYAITSHAATVGRIITGDVETCNASLNRTPVTVEE